MSKCTECKYERLSKEEHPCSVCRWRFSLWTDGYLLSEYSSKTKAKDILNLIEKFLTEYQSNYVFYMSQDEDVEV